MFLANVGQANTVVTRTDNRWIYLWTQHGGISGIFKLSVAGGSPLLVSKTSVSLSDVLSDGRLLGSIYVKQTDGPGEVRDSAAFLMPETGVVTPLNDVPLVVQGEGQLTAEKNSPLVITPTEDAISYVDIQNGIPDVWSWRIQDGKKRRVTRLSGGVIFWFAWSPGGKSGVIAWRYRKRRRARDAHFRWRCCSDAALTVKVGGAEDGGLSHLPSSARHRLTPKLLRAPIRFVSLCWTN